ncbi:MAG: hypothetical protein WD468_01210 [Pirellulales bacterium]
MHTNLRLSAFLTAFVALDLAAPAPGQQLQLAADGPVKQAAFDRPAASDAPRQSVRFGRQPVRIGDEAEQTIALEMRLKLVMRRANELIGKNQTTMRTSQRRVMTTTAVEAGRTMAVTVRYPEATKQVIGAPEAEAPAAPTAADASAQSPPMPQPVQGKTYHCQRELGENGKLVVTDEAGNRPPADEYDIVAQQMDIVGRPNPLAQFLAGRTVAVGEKLELPKDLAAQIFNLGHKFGEVTRFALTLQKLQPESGANCAVFLASVEAVSNDASQMRLQVEGPLVLQVASCRAVRIGLVGPIGMSETRGSYSTAYQVIGTGRLQMNIASAYRETK